MTYYNDADPYTSKKCEKCGEDASIYTGRAVTRLGLTYKFYHLYPCWEEMKNDKMG